jgi:hypothetical protein
VHGQSGTGIVVIGDRQPDLPHMVDALRPPRGLSGALHRGKQEADDRADDRDHHKQFDEGEPAVANPLPAAVPHSHGTASSREQPGNL